jgi:hypothetical protein
MHHRRGTRINHHFSKRAIAAPDIEPAQTRTRGKPVKESRTNELAPPAHVSFVGSAIVEADWVEGHCFLHHICFGAALG